MFRFSFSLASSSSSSSSSAATSSCRVVLRNIPPTWGRRAKVDVDQFVRRVVAAQPILTSSRHHHGKSRRMLSTATKQQNEGEDNDQMQGQQTGAGIDDNHDDFGSKRNKTVPAGLIPPHVRDRWGLPSSAPASSAKSNRDEFEEMPGLAKYFSKNKNRPQQEQSQQQYQQQEDDNINNTLLPPDAGVVNIKFVGEIRRKTLVHILFESPQHAKRFSDLVDCYIDELRRGRGISIPSSLVGSTKDVFRLRNKVKKQQQKSKSEDEIEREQDENEEEGNDDDDDDLDSDLVSAATLDRAVADAGLHVIPTFPEFPDSKPQTVEKEKVWRKEMALSAFRAAGSPSRRHQQHQRQFRTNNQYQEEGEEDGDENLVRQVRSRSGDIAHQKDQGNLAVARAQELESLYSSNPLLQVVRASSSSSSSSSSSNIDNGNNEKSEKDKQEPKNNKKLASSVEAKEREDLVHLVSRLRPQTCLNKLLFSSKSNNRKQEEEREEEREKKNQQEDWERLAELDELDTCASIDLDRYLMSPDVLWDTRKKYMPRRIWSTQWEGDDEEGDEQDILGDGGEEKEKGFLNEDEKKKSSSLSSGWWSSKQVYS